MGTTAGAYERQWHCRLLHPGQAGASIPAHARPAAAVGAARQGDNSARGAWRCHPCASTPWPTSPFARAPAPETGMALGPSSVPSGLRRSLQHGCGGRRVDRAHLSAESPSPQPSPRRGCLCRHSGWSRGRRPRPRHPASRSRSTRCRQEPGVESKGQWIWTVTSY